MRSQFCIYARFVEKYICRKDTYSNYFHHYTKRRHHLTPLQFVSYLYENEFTRRAAS